MLFHSWVCFLYISFVSKPAVERIFAARQDCFPSLLVILQDEVVLYNLSSGYLPKTAVWTVTR